MTENKIEVEIQTRTLL